jgi:hypothetical protein
MRISRAGELAAALALAAGVAADQPAPRRASALTGTVARNAHEFPA